MRVRSLIILIVAILVGIAAYYFLAQTTTNKSNAGTELIPGLSEKLNDVTKLEIVEAGNTLLVTIVKTDDNWEVENREGYEANIKLIRKTFIDLAEAKLVEEKTSNPENYTKLGVEDVSDFQAKGVQFSVSGIGESVKIILGNDGNSGRNTQYVRYSDEPQSWLINKKLDFNKDTTHWLRKDLFDIPPERIREIEIHHPDGSVINLENQGTEEYEFVLLNELTEGEKVSESEIYQVANALSSLQFTDVTTREIATPEEEPEIITTIFKTYDGLTITASSFYNVEKSYTYFDVVFNAEDVIKETTLNEENSTMNSNAEVAKKFAEEISLRIGNWVYILPTITKEAMVKKLEDFILAEDV